MLKHPDTSTQTPARWRRIACRVVLLIYAMPIGWFSYGRLQEIARDHRTRLIVTHQLWTLHPEYRGTPQTWTRFASQLLTDRQLLRRVQLKYGELGELIALDYRRDLTIAQTEVLIGALAVWIAPLAAGYVLLRVRRRNSPPKPAARPQPASVHDSRYRE